MNLDKRLIQYAVQFKTGLALTILFTVAAGLSIIFQAKTISSILNSAFLQNAGLSALKPLFISMTVIIVLRAVLAFLSEMAAHRTAASVKNAIRGQLLDKLSGGKLFVEKLENSGELSTTMIQGVDTLEAYFSQYLPQLVIAVMIPLSILVVVFPLDWISGVTLLVTAPLIPLFMVLIGKTAEESTQKQWNAMRRMSVHFIDTLQGLKVLRSLNRFDDKLDQIKNTSEQYRAVTMKVLQVTFLSSFVLELVGTLSTAVIAVQIGLRLLYGRLDFEPAFFILVIAPEFYLPLRQLGLRFHTGMSAVSAAQRIFELLAAGDSVDRRAQAVPQDKQTLTHFESLSFQSVSFSYPDRQGDAVSDLSFEIKQGEQVAIVGPSGSGKSTIMSLLLGFIQPVGGTVMINNMPLGEDIKQGWREMVSWIPQKPHLFNGTLSDNITLGRPDATAAEIAEALALTGLSELVGQLPEGLNTSVGANGTRLSGGESQRVALARAFLKHSQVLIMDEPTANLDLELEQGLVKAIDNLRKGKTVIMIAHRLSSIQSSDRVIYMENGCLVEQGRPGILQASGGRFAEMLYAYRGIK